jgi:hypothetical protein
MATQRPVGRKPAPPRRAVSGGAGDARRHSSPARERSAAVRVGNALGAKGRHQRAVDLAAISAAQVMRDLYPRLCEPPFVEPDVPNPHHLEEAEYRALAIAPAVRGGRTNGVVVRREDVAFPGAGFAPTRVTVRVRGEPRLPIAATRVHEAARMVRSVPDSARRSARRVAADHASGARPSAGCRSAPAQPRRWFQRRAAAVWWTTLLVAATTARSPTGKESRCGPMSPPRSTASRPRHATRLGSSSASPVAFAQTPSRLASSPRIPTPSGSLRQARASTETPPSSTSARRPYMAGSPPTPGASASSRGTAGKLGTMGCD